MTKCQPQCSGSWRRRTGTEIAAITAECWATAHPQFVFISFSKSYEAEFDKWISLVGKRPDQFDPLSNKLFHENRRL
jgi:hypothetical protein